MTTFVRAKIHVEPKRLVFEGLLPSTKQDNPRDVFAAIDLNSNATSGSSDSIAFSILGKCIFDTSFSLIGIII